jgi:hypothetical protein
MKTLKELCLSHIAANYGLFANRIKNTQMPVVPIELKEEIRIELIKKQDELTHGINTLHGYMRFGFDD